MKRYIFANPDLKPKENALAYLRHGLREDNRWRYRHSNAINEVDSVIFSFDGELLAELVVSKVVSPTPEDIADWYKTRKVYIIREVRVFRDKTKRESDFPIVHSQFGTKVPDAVYDEIVKEVGGIEEIIR